jgi:hypothetical protein
MVCAAGTWVAVNQTGGANGSLRLELAQRKDAGLNYGQVSHGLYLISTNPRGGGGGQHGWGLSSRAC